MSNVPTVNAYAVVPEKEQEVLPYTVDYTATTTVELDQPATRFVSSEFVVIPEARGVSWQDDFFEDGIEDIVAVFDFDYDGMESHYKCLGWGCLGVTSFCCPSTIPWMLLALVPCNLNRNVRWNVRAQHIALTRTGILFVHDQRPACWGEFCCSVAKRTKFVPYEQITQCEVSEGNTKTCLVRSDLAIVNVGTKSSPGRGLEISGLKNPHAFQELVMALKRSPGNVVGLAAVAATPTTATGRLAAVMENRGRGACNNHNNEEVAVLLREIRDELRQNNNALRALEEQPQTVQPSAPLADEE